MSEKVVRLDGGAEIGQCHLMPCRIEHKGTDVKAKEYFWPTIKTLQTGGDEDQGREKKHDLSKEKSNSDNPILTASFRGRPLQGRRVRLPEGYQGVVMSKKPASFKEDNKAIQRFNEFTYWNWDELPSDDDTVVKGLHWIELAAAIHSEPEEKK